MQTIMCTKAESIEHYNNYIDFNDLHNYEHAHATSNKQIGRNETKKIMQKSWLMQHAAKQIARVLKVY